MIRAHRRWTAGPLSNFAFRPGLRLTAYWRVVCLLIALLLAAILMGCGGGGSLLGGNPQPGTTSAPPPTGGSPTGTPAASPAPATSATRFLLRSVPTVATLDVATQHGLTLVSDDHGVALVAVPSGVSVDAKVAELNADTDVLDFEPDATVNVPETTGVVQQSTAGILDQLPAPSAASYFGAPVLGAYLSQPAVSLIRIQDVHSTFTITGAGTVAIIDTGVDPNHSALSGSLVPGYDFVHDLAGNASEMGDLDPATAAILTQSTAGILDKNKIAFLNQSTAGILDQSTAGILDTSRLPAAFGHGTMVAGIVHLTAPTAKIMPLKAFSSDGTAQLFDIVRAVYYAADHGAKVINMSFSLVSPSKELERAIGYAKDRGALSVASAGNTGTSSLAYPAALTTVIGVASTSNADVLSTFSSFGVPVALAAPGEAIITTYPGQNYAVAWGTSFSAPFVSGGTSLLFQKTPLLELSGAKQDFSNAKPVSAGLMRVDLYQAVLNAQ